MPKTTIVSTRPDSLTRFDPIRHVPTQMDTFQMRAATNNTILARTRGNSTTVVTATRTRARRTTGEQGIALPRRDYKPTLIP